jgi:hypothetical protein
MEYSSDPRLSTKSASLFASWAGNPPSSGKTCMGNCTTLPHRQGINGQRSLTVFGSMRRPASMEEM